MSLEEGESLDRIYEFAVQLGKDAGARLLTAATRMASGMERSAAKHKANAVDLVTETDKDIESFIKEKIAKTFPTHKFIGEESYSEGSSREYQIGDEPTWCIDPLDGTVNFCHLFPMFCVSIGFILRGKPTIGVIYAPMINQLFSACVGKGAWLNESQRLPLMREPIPELPKNAPGGCIFSCEFGKQRKDGPNSNFRKKIESFVSIASDKRETEKEGGMAHGVRCLGSAAMDLAYTALGAFDIWWEGGCWEWDVAAGICILQEAGGLVTTGTPPGNDLNIEISEVGLGSRMYLAIRPAGPSEEETGSEGQERVVKAIWKLVNTLDYPRQ
ncbi:inositol monophosphatase [Microthyrium microscopicum]|uniref:Inositol-1-monophosphatase n=1 Tax=Microthyrium microscopicum TaxID=703497 RepID=A0A6A6UMK1_9PEZI|nr:inositol monophosphatase [Microthyrium microscopicum]